MARCQTTHENGLSTGHFGGLIIEMNDILCNEFYPALGSNKTCWFEETWGSIQSLLCVEAISAAENIVKIMHELPVIIQQSPAVQSYAAVTQSNVSNLSNSCIQPVLYARTQKMCLLTGLRPHQE